VTGGGIVRGELDATLASCLAAALDLAAGLLEAAQGSGTLVVGAPTSATWGRVAASSRPLVSVAPDPEGPYGRALLERADAVCVLHRQDLPGVRDLAAPVVVTGVPAAPAGAPRAAQISRGRAWLVHEHWLRDRGGWPAGVALVGGTGSNALAAAHCAWRDGRAVVALCDGPAPRELSAGGALIADGPLEAVEAVALLASAPPLRRAFARRGRAVLEHAPSARAVAERMLEATLAAAVPAG
jgi:hypothetical protein